MTRFVKGNRPLLLGSHHLGLLFQSADNTVNGIQEILLAHRFRITTSGNQGRLVTHIGDIGSRETRRLS